MSRIHVTARLALSALALLTSTAFAQTRSDPEQELKISIEPAELPNAQNVEVLNVRVRDLGCTCADLPSEN